MSIERILKVPVGKLRLDRRNPRLIGTDEQASDEMIIARLYRSAELNELLDSMSANGYMDIEPLIVMDDPDGNNDQFIVLEGNRRLAALRLLREQDLVAKIKAEEKLPISIPSIDQSVQKNLNEANVSVYTVQDREAARSFIGFKHINGPAKWGAYAKAQFAAEWYKNRRSENIDLEDIAKAIGDKHDTIKRMVFAIYVLEQAKRENLFDIENDRYNTTGRLNFSHLYTALACSEYMTYLGLDTTWRNHDPSPMQIPGEKLDRLKKVLVWIYGSKKDDTPPVIQTQNPDIKRLGEVLASREACHMLEANHDLNEAHTTTQPVEQRLAKSLFDAEKNIRNAAGLLIGYDGHEGWLLDVAERVVETARTVYERMDKKRKDEINEG